MSYYTSIHYKKYLKFEKSLNLSRNQKAPNAVIETAKKIIKAPFIFVFRWTLAIAFWGALIALIFAFIGHFGLLAVLFLL